ncbi:hypothetical protein N0V86_003311 [Didymella sp. IMI 355093]|nr:hypothetical protein N0V86_003311 [Didymella sp. IMI 355093]
MVSSILALVAIAAIHLKTSFASPTPHISKNTTDEFPDYSSIEIGGKLPGEGHINGQVMNNCPFPVYVRQAVAEFSAVTGDACEGFGETEDQLVKPGETYVSERPTYWDGCGSSRK